ncbi:hypothetical protein TNCV_4396661 [Trichonephila clavipes]|uniref:Uncharacterized protein n=1 Tax=Trichonephila clavipes TaxID=2585209 RepID=A0A8X6W5H9_TRICX|nr:hypothetical protein TNCV_4396661 [Trichonephila clavipes]
MRLVSRAASWASRSLKCARGRHRFGPSCWSTDVKSQDESSFILSNRMWVEPSVANHGSRVKNGIGGLMQNSTHALHCNPTMTHCLITKRTLPQLTSI